jgi:hypothetical protein
MLNASLSSLNRRLQSYNDVITKNSTSCKMGHHHILRFLFVRGLTKSLLVGGLGVEDPTEWPPPKPDLTACVVGPNKKAADQNQ